MGYGKQGMRKKQAFIVLNILMCLGLFIVSSAESVTMVELSVEELALRADCIIVARCIDKKDIWDPYEPNVDTFATFEIKEYLKNDLGVSQIAVRHLNENVVAETKDDYDGLSFAPEEEVVLFLTEKDLQGYRHVLGLSQGKILVDRSGSGESLYRDMDGILLYDVETGEVTMKKREVFSDSFDAFKEEVCEALYKAGGQE